MRGSDTSNGALFTLISALSLASFIAAASVLPGPHFEAHRRKGTVLIANSSQTVSIALGETVTLVCVHPDATASVVIGKWRNRASAPRDNLAIIVNKTFTDYFAQLKLQFPQLGRYEALHTAAATASATAVNRVNYTFSALNIRNFQLDDTGEYSCTSVANSQRSSASNISLILTNTIYGLRFTEWPTRRFVISNRRKDVPFSFLAELDRNPLLVNQSIKFQLCTSAPQSGGFPLNCSDENRCIGGFQSVSSTEKDFSSRWSDFWTIRKVRELWNCTINITNDLIGRSLVVHTTDRVTNRMVSDHISFSPSEDSNEPFSLHCVQLSHQSYVQVGDIVTILCRVRPASRASAYFWQITTKNGGDSKSVECSSAQQCRSLENVRVHETQQLNNINEAQMRIDITVELGSSRWSYRAAVRLHDALFYSETFIISAVSSAAGNMAKETPRTQVLLQNDAGVEFTTPRLEFEFEFETAKEVGVVSASTDSRSRNPGLKSLVLFDSNYTRMQDQKPPDAESNGTATVNSRSDDSKTFEPDEKSIAASAAVLHKSSASASTKRPAGKYLLFFSLLLVNYFSNNLSLLFS